MPKSKLNQIAVEAEKEAKAERKMPLKKHAAEEKSECSVCPKCGHEMEMGEAE